MDFKTEYQMELNRGWWFDGYQWVRDPAGLVIDIKKFDVAEFPSSVRNKIFKAGRNGIEIGFTRYLDRKRLQAWADLWTKFYPSFKTHASHFVNWISSLEKDNAVWYLLVYKADVLVGVTCLVVANDFACFKLFFWDKSNKELRRIGLGPYQLLHQIILCKRIDISYLLLRGPQPYKLVFKPRIVNFKEGETIL